jgi:hypothetical protein
MTMAKSILLTTIAGAMGWGIRGQYGHETGAMIAGVLVSLVPPEAGSARSTTLDAGPPRRTQGNRDDSGYDSHPGRVLAREEIE